MKCPFCAHPENKVIDSRLSKDGQVIRRRRECNDCGKRFTTYERIEEIMPQVVKADGRREPFDRTQVMRGIEAAVEKRPVPSAAIERMVDEIEKALQETGEKEVESTVIAEEVLARLGDVDDIAYARYAARYGRYTTLDDLAGELNQMLSLKKKAGESGAAP